MQTHTHTRPFSLSLSLAHTHILHAERNGGPFEPRACHEDDILLLLFTAYIKCSLLAAVTFHNSSGLTVRTDRKGVVL